MIYVTSNNPMKTRLTTFVKTKHKISDDHTNIHKYRVAANITEYHIISNVTFLRIIMPKLMVMRQLFHIKILKSTCLKWTYGPFGHNYRVATNPFHIVRYQESSHLV